MRGALKLCSMMQIDPQARTTLAVRAEIARSTEPVSIMAKRYGISDETVRKWRKRLKFQSPRKFVKLTVILSKIHLH
jgi:transposase-like protein